MVMLLSVLFLCLPGAARKKKSATSAPCSTDSPVKEYPVVRRTGTQLEQQSSSEANVRRTAAVASTTPSSGAAENPMSPSAEKMVHLRMGTSSGASGNSNNNTTTTATIASRPGRTQLDDESNAAVVSHTGARAEKKRFGQEASSRSDKSEPKNGDSGGRQLSWHEQTSGGQSQEYLRRHYDKHGVEIPRNGPLTRLDVLLLERASKEKEAEAQKQPIEEERLKMEDRKKSESGKKKKKKRKDKKKDKSSSRRNKDKKKKKKEKKEGTKSGGSGSGGTTIQPTGETEKEEGLYTSKAKKKGGGRSKEKTTVTVDNAIADPTESAPAADAASETGRKAVKAAPQPKAKRPNWTDCVPESKLPDEWTETENSKNNIQDATKEAKEAGAKIPDAKE